MSDMTSITTNMASNVNNVLPSYQLALTLNLCHRHAKHEPAASRVELSKPNYMQKTGKMVQQQICIAISIMN